MESIQELSNVIIESDSQIVTWAALGDIKAHNIVSNIVVDL